LKYTSLAPKEIKIVVQQEAKMQFLKYGIAGTNMKKIASNVGIGRSTLYRYYAEKEQLAFHVAWNLIEDIINTSLARPRENKNATGFESLKAFFEEYILLLWSNSKILIYLTEFDKIFEGRYPEFTETQEFLDAINRSLKSISQYIIKGIEDGSITTDEPPEIVASVFLNAIMGTTQRVLPRSEHYDQEHGASGDIIVNKLLVFLLNSIKSR
jgi:AcrR family transcriptional regulator